MYYTCPWILQSCIRNTKDSSSKQETLSSSVHRCISFLFFSLVPQLEITFFIAVVVNAEGRPDKTGVLLANELAKLDIPVKLLIDSAVAYSMDEVDMVFVGADGVVESGGVINMMGTYQIALVAHSMNKPVYVAAESYKVNTQISSLFQYGFTKDQ